MLKNEQGMTLLELVLIIVVLAIGLTGVLLYFIQGAKDSSYAQNVAIATVLAQDLMEEIRSKCWDEPTTTPPPCNGAVTPSLPPLKPEGVLARAMYEEVNDFNGLNNTPPLNAEGGAMPSAYNIFTQAASVCYVAASDLNTCITGTGTSNYKKITVTISWGTAGDQVQLVSVATNH